jgi:hypothetical protein
MDKSCRICGSHGCIYETVARMREKRPEYRILVGKPEGKRPLGRPNLGEWTILKWILER